MGASQGRSGRGGRFLWFLVSIALLTALTPVTHVAAEAELVTANAGQDAEVDAYEIASLIGAGTTTTGEVVSFHWRQVSGSSVTIASPDAATTTFVAPAVDDLTDLTFELEVRAGNLIASDDVKITVLPNPDPPVERLNQSPYSRAGNPSMDKSDGRVYAVWSDAGATYFARRDVGEGTFGQPMQILDPNTQAYWVQSAPQVAARGATVYVAFEAFFNHSSPSGNVWATEVVLATSTDHGASFTTRRLTPTDDDYAAHSPKLAIADDGRIYLVYRLQTLTGMSGEMRAQSLVWDGSAATAQDLDGYVPSSGDVYDVETSGDRAGVVYQAGRQVRLRTFKRGAIIGDNPVNDEGTARNPKIAGLPGLMAVAWEQELSRPGPAGSGVTHEVLVRFVGNDGSLYSTTNISLSPDVDSTELELAAFGQTFAIGWLEGNLESSPYRTLRVASTGQVGTANFYEFYEPSDLARIQGAPGQEKRRLAISGDATSMHVAWSNTEPGVARRQIYLAQSSDAGLTFTKRKQISDAAVGCFDAVIETVDGIWSSLWTSGESWYLTQRVGTIQARSGGFAHDIAVTGVQIVQAPYGSTQLVQSHSTAVRALVFNGNATTQTVNVRLELTYGYKGRDDQVVVRESAEQIPAASTSELFLPEPLLLQDSEYVSAKVTVAPVDATANDSESNDSIQTPRLRVWKTQEIKVGYSPLNLPGDTTMTAEQVAAWSAASHGLVEAMFPVVKTFGRSSEVLPSIISSATLATGGALTRVPEDSTDPTLTEDQLVAIWQDLAKAARLSHLDMVVGITDQDFFAKRMEKSYLGLAPWTVPPADHYPAGLLRRSEAGKATVPHEIAHTYGLVNGPYMGQGLLEQPGITQENLRAHTGIRAPGYSPFRQKSFPAVTWDFMHPFGASDNPRWISAPMWDTLVDIFKRAVQDPPVIVLSGQITADDTVTLDTWYRMDSVLDRELGDPGALTIEYRDAGGDAIAQTGFDPAFGTTGWNESPSSVAPFMLRVPDVPGTASIALMRGTTVLAERVVSANSPTANVVFPNGGETLTAGEPVTISWNTNDADSDPVESSVLLSTDGGASWHALAIDTTEQSVSFTPSKSDVSETALIKVMSSDGINTSEDRSDAVFSIRPKTVPLASYGEPVLQAAISEFGLPVGDDGVPSMAVSGSRVYKIRYVPQHTENSVTIPARVYLDESTDGGATFTTHHLSQFDGTSVADSGVRMLAFAASGQDVYLVYIDAYLAITVSHDGGSTWDSPQQAHPGAAITNFKQLLVSGQDASMVFLTSRTGADENVEVVSSHDRGRTLEAPVTLMSRVFNPYGHLWADACVEGDRLNVVAYDEVTNNSTSPPSLKSTGFTVFTSIDAGRNWLDPTTVDTEDNIDSLEAVPDGDDLHIKYEAPREPATMPVHMVSSHDGGLSFGEPHTLSNTPRPFRRAFAAADGGTVAVQWDTGTELSATDPVRIMMAVSRDGGDTYGSPQDITHQFGIDNPTAFPTTSSRGVQVSGNNIYGLWVGALGDPKNGVEYVTHSILRVSTDFGETWNTPRDLCNTTSGTYRRHGAPLWAAGDDFQAVGPDLYYVWLGRDEAASPTWQRYSLEFRRGTGASGGGIGVDAGADQDAVEGGVVGIFATYSGASQTSTPTALIDWGDGAAVPADIIVSADSGVVSGTHTYTSAGNYAVRVTVTDDDGVVGVDDARVAVANAPPTVSPPAPLPRPTAGQAFALNDVPFSDPGSGETFSATVDWGDGEASTATVSVSPFEGLEDGTYGTVHAEHTYARPGTYEVRVTVSDGEDSSDTTMSITAVANEAPVAAAGGPYEVAEGSPVDLDGSESSDPDDDSLSYRWKAAGRTIGGIGYFSPWSEVVFADDYDGSIELSVADGNGGVDDDAATLRVTNVPPAFFEIASRHVVVALGESVEVTAAFMDAGRLDTHEVVFDWGDGSTSTASVDETQGTGTARGTHVYTASDTYTVTARVTDDDGASGETTFALEVEILNRPPVAADRVVSTTAGSAIAVTLTATDPDGDTLTWLGVPVVAPTSGTLAGTAPDLVYTPKPGFVGTDVFAFQVSDGRSGTDVARVTVNVTPSIHYTTLRGQDRYETAILVSRRSYPGTAVAAILVKGDDFPDALSSAPLARALNAPLLLTPSTGLSAAVGAELRRLKPQKVYVIGLPAALDAQVKAAVPGLVPTVIRGLDRYDTARLVAEELKTKLGARTKVVVAPGDSFPDALAVAPLAAAKGWPILLTPQSGTTTPTPTLTALASLGATQALMVGTWNAPPGVTPTFLVGVNRYNTCGLIADYAVGQGLSYGHLAFTVGEKFPDALAAAPYLAQDQGLIFLTTSASVPFPTSARIRSHKASLDIVDFIGLPSGVVTQVKGLME